MGFLKLIKHRGNIPADVGDLRNNKPWLTSSNRARLDDSSAPGIKAIEEELMKLTGVDDLFEVHHIPGKHCSGRRRSSRY
jgi:hypothetical protein